MRTGAEICQFLRDEIEKSATKAKEYAVPSWERTHNEHRCRFFMEALKYAEDKSDYESAGGKGK